MGSRFSARFPKTAERVEGWKAKAKSFFRNPERRASRLSLLKRVQLKRFLQRNARRIYRAYDTNEAAVYFIRRGKKRYIFRDGGESKEDAMVRYFAHLVLHEAFPENNIHPTGFETGNHDGLKKRRYGLVSFPVHGRNKSYKRYQWWDYIHRSMTIIPAPTKPEIVAIHEKFVEENALAFAERIKQETGIGVSVQPSNVMNVGGKPVFVEYNRVNVPTLLQFLQKNPTVREKVFKQLFPGALNVRSRSNWEKWIHSALEYAP